MQPTATEGVVWSVCVSVYLYIGHVHEPCKNGWMDHDSVRVGDLGGLRNHVLDGVQVPQRECGFFGFVWPIEKHCEPLLQCTQQKSITASAWLQQPTAMWLTGRCHINFPPVKKSTPLYAVSHQTSLTTR